MNKSDSIDQLAAALAAAQGVFPDISKDRTAVIRSAKGDYKYNYADLATILKAVRPALSKNGLALLQTISSAEPHVSVLETILIHSSGQWVQSEYKFPTPEGRWQETGSAVTYLRRYKVSAILGIATEEDDDATATKDDVRNETKTGAKALSEGSGLKCKLCGSVLQRGKFSWYCLKYEDKSKGEHTSVAFADADRKPWTPPEDDVK